VARGGAIGKGELQAIGTGRGCSSIQSSRSLRPKIPFQDLPPDPEAIMNHSQRTSPWSLVPPPLVFVSAFLAGMFLQRALWPRAVATSTPRITLGATLVGLGLALTLGAIGLFLAHRTTVIPHGQPSRFVARGPYRRTRNPMYVGLFTAYIGTVVWTGAWLAIPFIALPIVHLMRWVIPMEEAGLQERFGQEYDDYRARVRRWL
jgi:protein-S-isoprenylcysteine O-methyltransferase Ste14